MFIVGDGYLRRRGGGTIISESWPKSESCCFFQKFGFGFKFLYHDNFIIVDERMGKNSKKNVLRI